MINFNINHQALTNINNKRQHAIDEANNNFNFAMQNEVFKANYLKARSLQFEIAKLEFNKADTKKLNAELKNVYNTLSTQLKKLNLSPKSLKPNFSCKLCSDTGFLNGEECVCLKKEKVDLILKQNNLDKSTLPTFENVNFNVYDNNVVDNVKQTFILANNFITQPETKKLNFIIFGNTGVGKTYLSECMLSKALEKNLLPIFVSAYNLSEMFLKYHVASVDEKNNIIAPYLTCDLLIIDDLGSERILNNVTREYLYIIFSERTKNNLKTVISTNLTPDAIMDVYDERIFSRLVNKRESVLINLTGSDLRLKK